MKAFILILTIIFIPSFSFAEDINEQINTACSRHAISLVASLKSEVVGELGQEKSAQALQLATDSCQAYFKKEFSGKTAAVAAVEKTEFKEVVEEEDSIDLFTKKILSGDTKRKEGNKRLKSFK